MQNVQRVQFWRIFQERATVKHHSLHNNDTTSKKMYTYYTNEPRHDKTNKGTVRPAKIQISLGIRPVWSESSLCAQWVAKDPRFLLADSEDSDQTGRMPRLIWVFAWRAPLRKRLRIRSIISENYHYISVLCPFNLLIRFKCYNTV